MSHDSSLHPFLRGARPVAIAHRGGALEAPENTMEAFINADALGYRYLETDAQLTSDGVVVGFHDDSIDRVSEETGPISSWRWSDLQHVPITDVRGSTGRIASITELLDRFPEHRFNLDAKSDIVVEPLVDTIAHANAFDRVCLGSFSDARLRRARALATGNLCTSLGPKAIVIEILRSIGVPLPRPAGDAIQVPPSYKNIPVLNARLLAKAHKDGLAVHAWTIDERDEMRRLLDLGVDGIMTDRPSVLKTVFTERELSFPGG